jgi:hypothetical protein
MKLITPKIRTQLSAGHFPAGQLLNFFCCLGAGPPLTAGHCVDLEAPIRVVVPERLALLCGALLKVLFERHGT